MVGGGFSFGSDPEEVLAALRGWEDEVRKRYLRAVGPDDIAAQGKAAYSISMQEMLGALPLKTRQALLHQYERLIGFEQVISGLDPDVADPVGFRRFSGFKKPYWKRSVDQSQVSGAGTHPLAIIWNRANIQRRAGGKFGIGTNILGVDFLENLYRGMKAGPTAGIGPGKSIFVFDTETAGILEEFGGIRQVTGGFATTTMQDGRLGLQMKPQMIDEYFEVSRMQLGAMGTPNGGLTRLSDWVERHLHRGKSVNRGIGSGDAFADGIRSTLQAIIDSDYVVAHNLDFDLRQVFSNVMQTAQYATNEKGFRDLVDRAIQSMGTQGKLMDTLEMAKAQLPGLRQAAELDFQGSRSIHSLENIMLTTNLPDLLGRETMEQMFAGSGMMHAADVDVRVEMRLLEALLSGDLKQVSEAEQLAGPLRSRVLRSWAPTPISQIGDPNDIDARLLNEMIERTTSGREPLIRAYDSAANAEIDLRGKNPEVVRALLESDDVYAKYSITPLEQEIWGQRQALSTKSRDPRAMVRSLGQYRGYAGADEPYEGFLNKTLKLFKRGLRPSAEDYGELTRRLHAAGMPFAGISEPERMLTAGISSASSFGGTTLERMGGLERGLAEIGDDLGVSRFALWDKAYIGKSGAVTLPAEVLQAAGVLGDDFTAAGAVDMLGLSAHPTSRGSMVQLVAGMDEGQMGRLTSYLENLSPDSLIGEKTLTELGMNGRFSPQALIEAIQETGDEFGIRIGRLDDEAGEAAAKVIQDLMQGVDRDFIPLRGGLINIQDGVARVGAFVLDKLRGAEDVTAYEADIAKLRGTAETPGLYRQLLDAVQTPGLVAEVRAGIKHGENARRAVATYHRLKRPVAIGAAVTAAAVGIYKANQKRETQNFYDETLSAMPIERRSPYYSEGTLAYANSRLDPLATAGVTGNLDRNKYQRTNMSNDKYSLLYGGVF